MRSNADGSAVFSLILDPHLDGIVGSSVPAIRPFDRDDAISSGKFFQPEVIDFPGLEPIQVNVIEGTARAGIFLDQRERRAGHFVGLAAEAAREAADERGLAGPELAVQENHVAR